MRRIIVCFISSFLILSGCSKLEEKSWKTEYIEVVENWQSEKSEDALGYEFIYLDDDDIPELIVYCYDNAWCGFDMYTIYKGSAIKLELYDYEGEKCNNNTVLTSPGRQLQSDDYLIKQGIYMQTSGMMGVWWIDGYILEEGKLKKIYEYSTHEVNDGGQREYVASYLDKASGKIVKKQGIEVGDSTKAFDKFVEESYGFSFENLGTLFEENKFMDYNSAVEYLQE